MAYSERITPLLKQIFAVAGVQLNLIGFNLIMGATAGMLPQLRRTDSLIKPDVVSESWIAAMPSFATIPGLLAMSVIMARYGRKIGNILTNINMLIGWICIVTATGVTSLLIARFILGFATGMISCLGSPLIGEYTSPCYRGPFLTATALIMSLSSLMAHTLGSYLDWRNAAFIYIAITLVGLLVISCSPESPSWLAGQGKYDKCRTEFQWLRGYHEEDELRRMIETNDSIQKPAVSKSSATLKKKVNKYFSLAGITLKDKAFYMPVLMCVHIMILTNWSGVNILTTYTIDVLQNVVGGGADIRLLMVTIDSQRIFANFVAIYLVKKINRRTLLFSSTILNIFALAATAVYTYFKAHNMLAFDHFLIGTFLIHVHMFSIVTGPLTLCVVYPGELFAMKYKDLSAAISFFSLALSLFLSIKTFPFLLKSIGIHGAYCIYAGIIGYCLIVMWWFLPETKDRTLQDIEDEFRGKQPTDKFECIHLVDAKTVSNN